MHTDELRVVPAFANYRAEVEYLIRLNTDRRSLTKGQIASAFKRLRELPKSEGGTKRQRGGDRKSEAAKNQSASSSTLIEQDRGRDEAAALLGVGRNEAIALEKVFCTPGVPDELKAAVNSGAVAPTPAQSARLCSCPVRDLIKSSAGSGGVAFDASGFA